MTKGSLKKLVYCFVLVLIGVVCAIVPVKALEWDDPAGELQDDNTGLCYVLNDDASCYVSNCISAYATEEIVVPKTIQWEGIIYTVTSIGDSAFKGETKVKKIVLPNTITAIGTYAFKDMTSLNTLEIPVNVREIGQDFVAGCVNLTSLSVAVNNPYFSSDSVGCIYNKDKSILLFAAPSAQAITLPEGVAQLDINAITRNQVVEEVTIPSTIVTIPEGFFAYCGNLKKVTLNIGVKTIEQKAFDYCTNLEYVSFPEGLTHIGSSEDAFMDGVFVRCDNLKEVVLPDTMEYICRNAFFFCENLKKVTIYAKDATIESFAFADCGMGMTIYGYYGSTVQEYAEGDGYAFKVLDEPQIKGLVLSVPANKCKVKVTSDSSNDPTVAYTKSTNSKATSITIPDKVTVDGITYKVTSVAANALANNKKVTKVTVGKNVTSIGKNAFKNCKKLKTVTLKSTKLKTIGANTFSGCKNLKTITIKSTKLTRKSVGKNAFKGTNKKLVIKVPKKKVSSYKKFLKTKGNKKVTVKKG